MAYTRSNRAVYRIADFSGDEIDIPVAEDDDDRYFVLSQTDGIRDYYGKNGYVVVRGLLPRHLCDSAAAMFETEVKPFGGFIYRQTNGNPERHVFTNKGFVLNSIQNVQSLDGRHFAGFRQSGLDFLAHANMRCRGNRPHDRRLGCSRGHCAGGWTVLRLPQEPPHRHGQKRWKLRHRLPSGEVGPAGSTLRERERRSSRSARPHRGAVCGFRY